MIIYALKGLRLISARKVDVFIGAYIVAISVSFLALLAYLVYNAGLIPSIPKSSRGRANIDSSDDFLLRFVAGGVWILLCGLFFVMGMGLMLGKSLFGKSTQTESEPISWRRAMKGEVKPASKHSDEPLPWWLVAVVLAFMMYACVQGFTKVGS